MSREEELFATVRLLPPAERADYLDRECGGDSALRARIEELLAGYEESQRALATPFVTRGRDALEEAPGHRIGRYKLLQKIGEGGCGVVWMAEQEEPVRRRVALKVIKLGPKPSARWRTLADAERTTLARLRNTAPSRLSIILRGDLDWIVMRCLEKNRTRRYDTASALAADIEHHLRHEPVVARPPGTGYLVRKWIRRHRLGFVAAAAVAVVLALGIAISTWQAWRAAQAERHAVAMQRVAEAQALSERRRGYAGDMLLVQQALDADDDAGARDLLERHRPPPRCGAGAATRRE